MQHLQMDVIPDPSAFQIKAKEYCDSKIMNTKHMLLAVDEYTLGSYAIPMQTTADVRIAFNLLLDEINLDKVVRIRNGIEEGLGLSTWPIDTVSGLDLGFCLFPFFNLPSFLLFLETSCFESLLYKVWKYFDPHVQQSTQINL